MAHHLTLEEREVIAHMRSRGRKPTEIARRLGRADSTISRELQRNRSRNGYWAVAAQKKADARRRQRPRVCKLQRPEVRRYVQQRLRQYWSPDQIAVRSRADFPRDRGRQVSHQTIYAWIQAQDAAGQHWRRYLRSAGWRRRDRGNRGQIPACTSIEGRPAVVDRRSRYGDWEGDTVVGAGRRGGAVTLVERKSGYLLMGKARQSASRDGSTIRSRAVSHHATRPAEDADAGQRQGVCRTSTIGGGSLAEDLLRQALLCLAARHQRKHQRPDPSVLPERHGSGQHSQSIGLPKSNIS